MGKLYLGHNLFIFLLRNTITVDRALASIDMTINEKKYEAKIYAYERKSFLSQSDENERGKSTVLPQRKIFNEKTETLRDEEMGKFSEFV